MTTDPRLVWLTGFAGLMIAAAIVDFRRLIIPNPLVGGLCVLWLLDLETTSDASPATVIATIGCAAAVFLVGAVLFSRGLIGGGDWCPLCQPRADEDRGAASEEEGDGEQDQGA